MLVAVGLLAAACGGGSSDPTDAPLATTTTAGSITTTTAATPGTTAATTTTAGDIGGAVELKIAAEDSEGYTIDRLTAAAGQEITVEFQNKDVGSGEPHNWHVIVNPGVEEYATPITEGPDTQTVTFTIGTPGEYDFWCDTHLEAMQGILTITP
jgi:plastocyanin